MSPQEPYVFSGAVEFKCDQRLRFISENVETIFWAVGTASQIEFTPCYDNRSFKTIECCPCITSLLIGAISREAKEGCRSLVLAH